MSVVEMRRGHLLGARMNFPTNPWYILLQVALCTEISFGSTWSEWWTYEGISGPDFWGLVNPEWYVCTKGRRQSPINIDPKQLLFDPNLKTLRIDKHMVSGTLHNTGHDIRLTLEDPSPPYYVNVSGGPLTYQYRTSEIIIHFGSADENGSEHTVNGIRFPAEVQIMGYNSDLYGNLTQAMHSTNGLTMISLLAQVGKKANKEFDTIVQHLKTIRHKGQQVRVRYISVFGLLPFTENYITYEGSLTQPGCQETVTWIIFNKPIYISAENLKFLREVMQGDSGNPKVSMSDNYRPTQPAHQRPVRTNINFHNPTQTCTMDRQMFYQANVPEKS